MSDTLRSLEADPGEVQIGRINYNMPSCMSKYRFVSIRIPILTSKKFGHIKAAGG